MNNQPGKSVEEMRIDIENLRNSLIKLTDSGMKEKTILVLMNHYTGLPQRTIKAVFDGIECLEHEYFGED